MPTNNMAKPAIVRVVVSNKREVSNWKDPFFKYEFTITPIAKERIVISNVFDKNLKSFSIK
jgi:hypothetical protein